MLLDSRRFFLIHMSRRRDDLLHMSIQEEKKTVHEKIISGCISRWPLPPEVRVMLVTQAAVPLWPPLRSRGLLKGQGRERKKKNYSTEYSHVVPHHSTDSAIKCLTAQIGRDAVVLLVYGRNSKV